MLRLPGLEHLASDVSACLHEGVTSLDVAARLHPSAAVSGTPREQADEIIARPSRARPRRVRGPGGLDGRERQTASGRSRCGWRISTGERSAVLQAGGGLVAASDPVSEHAEALAKCRPMLRALRGDAEA